jgi:hypothetical protein
MFVVMLWVKLRSHSEQLAAVAPGGEDVLDHYVDSEESYVGVMFRLVVLVV